MGIPPGRIPLGPEDPYRPSDDLLSWMSRQFAEFGDIYKASLFGTTMYATRNPDFAYRVLVENWQNYVKGQIIERVALLMGNGIVTSEGELWKRQRRMIQPSFSHESIAKLTRLITSVNLPLLEKWQAAARDHQTVNVTQDVSCMALEVILRFLLGDDYDRVKSDFDLLTQEKARDMHFARAFLDLRKIIQLLIDRRHKEAPILTDALGMFLEARDPQTGEGMSDRQLIDEILTMVVAGHETSAATLAWAWYLLSQHPDVERKLHAELGSNTFSTYEDLQKFPYTRQIIDEVMRLYPALWLVSRRAIADDMLGDYFVPAGTEIYTPPYFIQRNPGLWPDPERFDPDRFRPEEVKQRHRLATIPFGAGPRNCIGTHFARVEMQIHLMTIAGRLRLCYQQEKPLEIDAGVNLRNKYDFLMYPVLRPTA